MDKFYNQALLKLETAINKLENGTDCSIQRIETIIHLIVNSLAEVKEYVLKKGFKTPNEEIRFFRFQKPVIVAKQSRSLR